LYYIKVLYREVPSTFQLSNRWLGLKLFPSYNIKWWQILRYVISIGHIATSQCSFFIAKKKSSIIKLYFYMIGCKVVLCVVILNFSQIYQILQSILTDMLVGRAWRYQRSFRNQIMWMGMAFNLRKYLNEGFKRQRHHRTQFYLKITLWPDVRQLSINHKLTWYFLDDSGCRCGDFCIDTEIEDISATCCDGTKTCCRPCTRKLTTYIGVLWYRGSQI